MVSYSMDYEKPSSPKSMRGAWLSVIETPQCFPNGEKLCIKGRTYLSTLLLLKPSSVPSLMTK